MLKSNPILAALITLAIITACSPAEESAPAIESTGLTSQSDGLPQPTGTESFTVFMSGRQVGQLEVSHDDITTVAYEYRNNGRGPSLEEVIEFDDDGYPTNWAINGATTFGNGIEESFQLGDDLASWTDTTGFNEAALEEARLYFAQESSPFSLWVYSRLLLEQPDRRMAILPAGEIRLEEIESIEVGSGAAAETVTTYALSGFDLNPTYFALDGESKLFATMSERFALVRAGFEAEEQRLRELTGEYATQRFESIQQRVSRNLEAPVRITNVRLFDPASLGLTEPVSVLVEDNRIQSIGPASPPATGSERRIDGEGGTLVAGMYEMHGHIGQGNALLNIAAGVTSVRDMGNANEVLDEMVEKIESGRLVGPRITRSGFIEGLSPFSSSTGVLVNSQEEAIAAVQQYANGDFYQIKIYNSMNPEWVPAMIAEARRHGLRVAGHVPAFSNADAMIAAGYDEMTHINQVMLGWVLEEGEDTRTLLRLTALKRLPELDINSEPVQFTIRTMAEQGVAIDPTLAIHETLMLSRNGSIDPGMLDYIDHMPVAIQRDAMTARAEIATPEDDEAYRLAFDKIIETVAEMRRQGVFIIPGTDLGGSFTYHRELEMYELIGMSPAEILKMATYDMAEYLQQEAELGSIEPGKLADFFLIPSDPTADLKAIKTISMVMKNGEIYFPSEIYAEFGITPFIDAPAIR
jgi:imidazolonepropionase-like amidohydrolase